MGGPAACEAGAGGGKQPFASYRAALKAGAGHVDALVASAGLTGWRGSRGGGRDVEGWREEEASRAAMWAATKWGGPTHTGMPGACPAGSPIGSVEHKLRRSGAVGAAAGLPTAFSVGLHPRVSRERPSNLFCPATSSPSRSTLRVSVLMAGQRPGLEP